MKGSALNSKLLSPFSPIVSKGVLLHTIYNIDSYSNMVIFHWFSWIWWTEMDTVLYYMRYRMDIQTLRLCY